MSFTGIIRLGYMPLFPLLIKMVEWTEKQLREFWEKKTPIEKEEFGSYEDWKESIIPEID